MYKISALRDGSAKCFDIRTKKIQKKGYFPLGWLQGGDHVSLPTMLYRKDIKGFGIAN